MQHETIVQQSARVAHFFAFLCGLFLPPIRPPKLQYSQKRKQPRSPKAARQDAAPPAKTQISAPYSGEPPWCQTPSCKRWWGYGWFLTGFTGLTGLRDEGRNAEGAEITRRARRGKGNSDWWQGYANAPPFLRLPVLSMKPLYIIRQLWAAMAAINDNCRYHRSCSPSIKLPISGGIIFSKEILTFENPYKRISERSSPTNSFSTLSAT